MNVNGLDLLPKPLIQHYHQAEENREVEVAYQQGYS